METLLAEPRTDKQMAKTRNSPHYISIDGVSEKVFTIDEVFSRMKKNLNAYYGTNYQLV